LAGVFASAEWSLEEAKEFHSVLYKCLWPRNPELRAADIEVTSTFAKHSANGQITGALKLIGLLDKKVVDAAFRWLGIDQTQNATIAGTIRETPIAWRTCTAMN
jgi:hypothetical protein